MREFDVTIRVNSQSKCDNPIRGGYCYLPSNICPCFGGFQQVKSKMMTICNYKKKTKKERIKEALEEYTVIKRYYPNLDEDYRCFKLCNIDMIIDEILAIMEED